LRESDIVKQKSEIGNRNRRAVFLDRDGTINIEKDYLHRPEEFEFIPGVPEAISIMKDAGYLVVVVTNQSGVARGYYGESEVERIHRHMDDLLAAQGTSVDGYYFCPHHPENGVGGYRKDCDCRKPLPGMLMKAATDLHIDLSASWMVGDKLADIEAGLKAGCRAALVLTGYGTDQRSLLADGVPVYADLLTAAMAIAGR
jgi:D-glycero-D-manno-heptose 1,7-bisphosphate phosphatase